MDRRVDPDWVAAELSAAIAAGDTDRITAIVDIAERRGVTIPSDLVVATEPQGGALLTCGACAWDATDCTSAGQLVACALPVELTPLGDLNALRRQAGVALSGGEVDTVEAGLATVGILSSVAVLASGGSSAALKASATLVRVMRRAGRLSPSFMRRLTRTADLQLDWRQIDDLALGRVELAQVMNLRRFDRLSTMVGDAMRLGSNTSVEDVVALLPRVSNPSQLKGLARLSDVAGDSTRPAVETLGLARAIRTVTRVTDVVLAVIGGVLGLLGYLAGLFLSGWLRRLSTSRRQGLH